MAEKGQNLAGPCPFCNGKSSRQFQVNLTKNAWYCFGCKQGGNVLDFVARREGVGVRAAAMKLDTWFELGLREEAPSRTAPPATPAKAPPVAEETLPSENPPLTFTLKTLDPHHEALVVLDFKPSTIQLFGAGYCTKGLLRGRLAIPIHDSEGALVAYTGLAIEEDDSPRYLFPPKFCAALEVFGLHRPTAKKEDRSLYLTPEIEGVLRLSEAGVTPVLGLFDGSLSSHQEEILKGVATLYERLILVGDGFPERTVARLARHVSVSWISDLTADPEAELAEPLQFRGEA